MNLLIVTIALLNVPVELDIHEFSINVPIKLQMIAFLLSGVEYQSTLQGHLTVLGTPLTYAHFSPRGKNVELETGGMRYMMHLIYSMKCISRCWHLGT